MIKCTSNHFFTKEKRVARVRNHQYGVGNFFHDRNHDRSSCLRVWNDINPLKGQESPFIDFMCNDSSLILNDHHNEHHVNGHS